MCSPFAWSGRVWGWDFGNRVYLAWLFDRVLFVTVHADFQPSDLDPYCLSMFSMNHTLQHAANQPNMRHHHVPGPPNPSLDNSNGTTPGPKLRKMTAEGWVPKKRSEKKHQWTLGARCGGDPASCWWDDEGVVEKRGLEHLHAASECLIR